MNQLYDDSTVAEDPYGNIGFTLRNEDEARAIESLIQVLDPLYDSLPLDADDAAVIAMPEWQAVVGAARHALRVFSEGAEPQSTG
ncbi:MAG: SCO4402 family protein [Actinomadura sp.]